MQNFSSSLYSLSYEVLLELANCFAVGFVFVFLNYWLSVSLLESSLLGYTHISYCGKEVHWVI